MSTSAEDIAKKTEAPDVPPPGSSSDLFSWLGAWVASGTPTVAAVQRFFGVHRGVATSPVWYWIFRSGAALGNENFFITCLPLLFWVWDVNVASRVVTAWSIAYFVGHVWKDTTRLPRPPEGAPHFVVRLERHYENEYGMPSTHAMNAILMPWYIVWLSWGRGGGGEGPEGGGALHATLLACALYWTATCILSRLYLGVHSPADVVCGTLLGCALLWGNTLAGGGEALNSALLSAAHAWWAAPLLFCGLSAIYPRPAAPTWLNSPGDTTVLLGSALGVRLGALCVGRRTLEAQWATRRLHPGLTFSEDQGGLVAGVGAIVAGVAFVVLTRLVVKTLCHVVARALLAPAYGPWEDASINDALAALARERAEMAAAGGHGPAGAPADSSQVSPTAQDGGADGDPTSLSSSPGAEAGPIKKDGAGSGHFVANRAEGTAGEASLKHGALGDAHVASPRLIEIPLGKRYIVELPTKIATYASIGFATSYLVPLAMQSTGVANFGF